MGTPRLLSMGAVIAELGGCSCAVLGGGVSLFQVGERKARYRPENDSLLPLPCSLPPSLPEQSSDLALTRQCWKPFYTRCRLLLFLECRGTSPGGCMTRTGRRSCAAAGLGVTCGRVDRTRPPMAGRGGWAGGVPGPAVAGEVPRPGRLAVQAPTEGAGTRMRGAHSGTAHSW